MTTWSVQLSFASFAKALARSFFPNTYVVWLLFAFCLTIIGTPETNDVSLSSIVVSTLLYFGLMIVVGVTVGTWAQLRRTKKLSGGLKQNYKLDAKTLSIQAGGDIVTIPRDSLVLKYCKNNLIVFRRKGTRLGGRCMMLFDSDADFKRVAKQLDDTA